MIRDARPADAEALLALVGQHAAHEGGRASIDRAGLDAILADASPPVRLIVAEQAAVVVSYAAITFDFALWSADRFAHLDCLFVTEHARGSGIGASLLAAARAIARQSGASRIEWQTPDWNAGAIRFYEREGALGRAKMRFSMPVTADSFLAGR